jgi:hypothetical protein
MRIWRGIRIEGKGVDIDSLTCIPWSMRVDGAGSRSPDLNSTLGGE